MICHYWYFKDIGYKFQPYVCNGCHDISMMAYELKNIATLNVDYRCILYFKIATSGVYFKIAPSKNAFQNRYLRGVL